MAIDKFDRVHDLSICSDRGEGVSRGMRQATRVLNLAGIVVWFVFFVFAGQVMLIGGLMAGNTVEHPRASASDLLELFGPLIYFGVCFLSTFVSRRSYYLLAAGTAAHLIGAGVVSTHANWFLVLVFLAFGLSWLGMYRELPRG
jgi:hypothetical protein